MASLASIGRSEAGLHACRSISTWRFSGTTTIARGRYRVRDSGTSVGGGGQGLRTAAARIAYERSLHLGRHRLRGGVGRDAPGIAALPPGLYFGRPAADGVV